MIRSIPKGETSLEAHYTGIHFSPKGTPQPTSDRYEIIGDRAWMGKYGLVVKARDLRLSHNTESGQQGILRAIKFLKPDFIGDRKVVDDFLNEIRIVARIDHPNVSRIYDSGFARAVRATNRKPANIPYYVMEWNESHNLQKFLKQKPNEIDDHFLSILVSQVMSALACCHSCKRPIVHLDIKPDNILIKGAVRSQASTPTSPMSVALTDFGKAKLLVTSNARTPAQATTAGGGMFEYVHPAIRPYLRHNSVPLELFKRIGTACDLFSFGVVLAEVIKAAEISSANSRAPLAPFWKYLADDLQKQKVDGVQPLRSDLSAQSVLELACRQMRTAPPQLFAERHRSVIRLQGEMSIDFPRPVRQLVDTPEFQRLRTVPQLALSDYVYPSATHTRFAHSLGSFHYAAQYCSNLSRNPVFAYLYDDGDCKAACLAALMHDLGQYAFAHYFEEIGGLDHLDVDHVALTKKIMRGDINYTSAVRAAFKGKTTHRYFVGNTTSIAEVLDNECDVDRILDVLSGAGKYALLSKIFNGPLDCDKLDYLRRDSSCSGVPYGNSIDIDRFLSALTICEEPGSKRLTLAVTDKGRSAVETIIAARFHMFAEVYWHKTARAAAAMVKEALWLAHKEQKITQAGFDEAVIAYRTDEFLQWLADCLSNGAAARDLIVDSLGLFNQRALYKRVATYSGFYAEDHSRKTYFRFRELLGNDYGRIYRFKEAFVKLLNKFGMTRKGWSTLSNHHVLIDVPSSQQDQFEGVTVHYEGKPSLVAQSATFELSRVSQLARAVHDSSPVITKRVRIFVFPPLARQVVALGDDMASAIADAWGAVR